MTTIPAISSSLPARLESATHDHSPGEARETTYPAGIIFSASCIGLQSSPLGSRVRPEGKSPGSMALTRMPKGWRAAAMSWVSCFSAALDWA